MSSTAFSAPYRLVRFLISIMVASLFSFARKASPLTSLRRLEFNPAACGTSSYDVNQQPLPPPCSRDECGVHRAVAENGPRFLYVGTLLCKNARCRAVAHEAVLIRTFSWLTTRQGGAHADRRGAFSHCRTASADFHNFVTKNQLCCSTTIDIFGTAK
jgi:hypothetical protein